MQKIVFLDRATLAPQIRLTRPSFEHELIEYDHTQADQVAARLEGATIAITNKVPLTADTLARLPSLKLVAVAATGTDCVDKEACEQHDIRVSNIRGYAVNTVPEHTFALMLALRRNLIAYRDDVLNGEWQRSGQFCFFNHAIHDLGGMTLGIIGEGVLGQRVAEIGKAFGMRALFAAHKGRDGLGPLYTPWDEVLATSDIITIHSPLTPQTRGMLAMEEFRAMKRKPLIINTARGGLVDEDALVHALDEELISGVGFDVLSGEPPGDDNPLMRIAKRPNVIVTPHVAWASDEAQQALADQLMENIARFVGGAPVNVLV
ncbi:glycerate dehydrogenase (plasmid) [Paraburkholderia sp. PGU19]|uniref:D-2-hydroxyacid dehydrogenase n=1 Tax=Paraburkholderia sp. PGU19 TaxID=2735434 RepID=UPI0015DB4505|nr:D-2-hydroxyacid dehydrogenase [Paraburkholderia sp. PGU19]BCG02001.1 glycerate dehydrogenase [Paraburkholderia sp. PGU19]